MTSQADFIARDAAAASALPPADAASPIGELLFQPETFFLGRTEGAGIVRDPFGRIVRRCRIVTEGRFDPAYRAIHFDETFSYDDGEVDLWRWVMNVGRDGRYVAAELHAGVGIAGERQGADYVLAFRRPAGRAKGVFTPRFATRFTQLSPDVALKQAKVSVLGAPVGTLVAFHRRIAD